MGWGTEWQRSNLMLDLASALAELSMHTQDYRTGVQSKVERRGATFTGR